MIWVKGAQVGTLRGAFIRGHFDISGSAKAGTRATIAMLVTPQRQREMNLGKPSEEADRPGVPHEHTLRNG